jgi:signal transduction histidine kinase
MSGVKGGLIGRILIASGVLALLIGGAFAILLGAIVEERDSAERVTRSQEVLAVANSLERLVVDLESGERGFLVAGEERFLAPWKEARATLPTVSRQLTRLARGPDQAARARAIVNAIDAYVREYSVPLVQATRRGSAAGRRSTTLDEGKRRIDAIRAEFDRFTAAERAVSRRDRERSSADARRAVVAGVVGLAGSVLLILVFSAYLTRSIVEPVRRAARMAGRLAGGDLSTRMPETGVGEIGALEHSFNTMAGSLQRSQAELRELAEEQAALRRVATLVARGAAPVSVLDAVAREVGALLGAELTRLDRYESDAAATTVAGNGLPELSGPGGEQFALETAPVAAEVLRTGRAARMSFDDAPGAVAARVHEAGITCGIGVPIAVEGHLWGVMVAGFTEERTVSEETEARMAQFTELVATAIANAESRAELAASRARVVATADETRRRIERDLHDGAQQRLVHTVITLKLACRALADADGPAAELVEEALGHAEHANTELRELAHGILPAALSRGGLQAGVETLVSRISLPVSIDIAPDRLPASVEATAYFIVAEALTNVVKHAHAESARVTAQIQDGVLRVEVRDDGVGGAQLNGSSGLVGLRDRVAALNGEITIESPPGGGTVLAATLPAADSPESASATGFSG